MARKQAVDENAIEPLELLSLAHLGKKADGARDLVETGDGQLVDFSIRIFGGVNVGSATSYKTPVKPDLIDVVALTIECIGKQADALESRLRKAYRKLALDVAPTVDENLRKQARELIDTVTREKEVHQRGRVSAALQHEILNRA